MLNLWQKRKIFAQTQFGFRENFSTTLAISHFREYLLSELDSNMFYIDKLGQSSIFINFDIVNHDILLHTLNQYEIRGLAFDLIKSYLQHRKQIVRVGNHSSSISGINIGVPQDSVLGPIFFLIYINDLTYNSDLKVTLYADDSVLSLAQKNIHFLQKSLDQELRKVDR